jgi:hypothetical protein
MGVISIEFAEPVEDPEPCPCCGGRTTRLTRFVYSDGIAHAVYYAQYSNNHPHKWVSALISLGEWGEGSALTDRVAFAVRIRSTENEYQVSIVDAAESPWSDVTFLGRILDRQEALKHKWKAEMFHITDHMVEEDSDIRGYFARD